MISKVHQVIVAVDEQERARRFWTETIGFTVARDASYGNGQRWLEVTPPDGSVVLVLSPRQPGEPKRVVPDELPHSPIFFACEDLEQTYRELTARGVKFPAPPVKMSWGWWSMFEDNEGTRYALNQS